MAAGITVAPATLNFSVRKGSTLRRTITWYSDPVWLDAQKTKIDEDNSTPLNLTGYTGRMQVRDKRTGTLVYTLTTENGGLSFGGAAGTITFYLSDADTDTPAYDKCKYDLEVINTIGDVIPLIAGAFVLVDQVTV